AVARAEGRPHCRRHHGTGEPAAWPRSSRMSVIETRILPTSIQRLVRSRRFCRRLTKSAARNFYYRLKQLPEPKRSAMFALYAYMRLVDDIADDEDHRSHHQRVEDLE